MASKAAKRLQRRVLKYAQTIEPSLRAAIFRAYDVIRTSLTESEIVALLRSGAGADRVVQAIANLDDLNRMLISTVGPTLSQGTLNAGAAFAVDLPTAAARAASQGGINLLNPNVLEGLAQVESRVFLRISIGTQETVRQAIARGLEAGSGSRAIAREIREVIGLAPNQERAVQNFERLLREGKLSEIIGRPPRPDDLRPPGRVLRDRRFDGTLRKAFGPGGRGLTEDQIQKMVAANRRKSLAMNANTQARSAALDATRRGQRMSWEDAIQKRLVKREESWKRRHAVGDRRTRPEHAAIDLEEQPFDVPYSNGEMVSGDASHNCRCSDEYFRRRVSTRARPTRRSDHDQSSSSRRE